jgi:signal transduction histidine kinase
MRTNTAEQLPWPAVAAATPARPDPGPGDLASCLAGPNGADLVAELAHDLRSPLTSILLLAEALQNEQGGSVTDAQRRGLGLIYTAALSLWSTASDVVEFARCGSHLVHSDPGPCSVFDMFASVRNMILPIAQEKGLEVRLVYPVPERRVGHARALSRVFLNLATNAVNYADAGFVEIAARPIGPARLEFSVRDTGPGIDPTTLKTLYQPFPRQQSAVRHHFSSAGLGLAICRKLVKTMGSELRLETRPGWGTRFFFELDLPPAAALP